MATFQNFSTTQGPFHLVGGAYGVTVHATFGGGTVTLQRLSADGSTYVPVWTFTSDGYQSLNLSAGTYEIAIATATAAYLDVAPIATVHY